VIAGPWLAPTLALAMAMAIAPGEEETNGPLALGDLAAYRAALAQPTPADAPKVTFRDLWNRPESFLGRPVRVRVRVARVFAQPPVGEFPALMEAWGFDSGRNPIALVAPASATALPKVGAFHDFAGTFLKRVHYDDGADGKRSAPLLVGPSAPAPVIPPAKTDRPGRPGIQSGVWLALILGLFSASLIMARHAARPRPRVRGASGPAPDFVDRPADPPNERP
jgi:hypothetical protein